MASAKAAGVRSRRWSTPSVSYPADPYYMEMRLRHTPPLPVGHVYIAYGQARTVNGEPLDERLVMLAPIGGYSRRAVAQPPYPCRA